MPSLTPRQQQILELILRQLAEQGLPPTRGELAGQLGLRNRQGIEQHLRALARKGYLELSAGLARGIRVREGARAVLALAGGLGSGLAGLPPHPALAPRLPLYGRIAAGLPTLADSNIEAELLIDPALFRPRADFLLRVRGESMREADIQDRDILAVHHTGSVRNGQIVVARLGDEATVKYYRRSGPLLTLEPANPGFEPIHVDLRRQHCVIEGLVVGVVRTALPMRPLP
ncbi:MAG TPA: transcriptional repressor LexA [Steroidobacteraceae bacterium]|nr:transcriptional repressor LexA [Steroidobacteraceae bacterium]